MESQEIAYEAPVWSAGELGESAVREVTRVVEDSGDHAEAIVGALAMLVQFGALEASDVEPLSSVTRALKEWTEVTPSVVQRVHDSMILGPNATPTSVALESLAVRLGREERKGRGWGRIVIGCVTGAHVGRAAGAIAVGAIAGAAAAYAAQADKA